MSTSIEISSPAKPRRADAVRNRQRVLDAARDVFAEQGRDAQMDDIAAHAGVGVGTVYRHFPDKAALMEALVAERFSEFCDLAREALEHTDPWEGFSGWLMACGELQAHDRGLADCLADALGYDIRGVLAETLGLADLTTRLIERGQAAGVIRLDARQTDVPLVMAGVATTNRCRAVADGWRRHLAIVLEGLRAPGTTKLPE